MNLQLVGMGAAATRALTAPRAQLIGSPQYLTLSVGTTTCVRQPSSRLVLHVPALTRSHNIHRKLVTGISNSKSLNISTAMDSTINPNSSIVTRAAMPPASFASPPRAANSSLRGLASAVPRDSDSAASTSDSSAHHAEPDSRPKEAAEKKSSHGLAGIFAIGAGILSTILSYILKFCGGGYTPYVKQAEKDIDKVADFVEAGAKLVIKVADEIEHMAHVADLSAQEAEDLALKVEAKTKMVRQTLDAIADVLEGDKKLSTVLTDYASKKKQTTSDTPKE